ncbi:hypothetical protein M9458_008099, partial [Cirrhinus mrigala]
ITDRDMNPDAKLWCLRQGGRKLERYVEEFLELANQLSWHDAALGACFLMGLDEDIIRCDLHACDYPLIELVNVVLYLNGSDFEVEESQVFRRPAPSQARRIVSVNTMPGAPTYRANDSDRLPHHPLPAAAAASTRTPPPAASSRRPPAVRMAHVLDPPFMSVLAANIRGTALARTFEPAASTRTPPTARKKEARKRRRKVTAVVAESSQTADSSHVTAAVSPESCQVADASPESSQVSAVLPMASQVSESSQVSDASSESRQLKAVFPEPIFNIIYIVLANSEDINFLS